MSFHCVVLIAVALLVAACSSTPKPLPGGPPPEYEQPRAFDAGAAEAPAMPPAAPTEPPVEPAAPRL